MTHEEQLRELARTCASRPTPEVFAARWQTYQETLRCAGMRAMMPPFVFREMMHRSALGLDVLDLELEKRWLRVAPPLRISTGGKIEGDIAMAMNRFAFGS